MSYSFPKFSDNGLIQFQSVTGNEQFLFPTAFPKGFRGNESVAMLAAFWDDADLTIGAGKLFYQVGGHPGDWELCPVCICLLILCIIFVQDLCQCQYWFISYHLFHEPWPPDICISPHATPGVPSTKPLRHLLPNCI